MVEPSGSSTIGAGPDEESWSWFWSEATLGGVGGVVLEVQLCVPVAHTVVPTLTEVDVTPDEASEPSADD